MLRSARPFYGGYIPLVKGVYRYILDSVGDTRASIAPNPARCLNALRQKGHTSKMLLRQILESPGFMWGW